jgi:hypothetical protein
MLYVGESKNIVFQYSCLIENANRFLTCTFFVYHLDIPWASSMNVYSRKKLCLQWCARISSHFLFLFWLKIKRFLFLLYFKDFYGGCGGTLSLGGLLLDDMCFIIILWRVNVVYYGSRLCDGMRKLLKLMYGSFCVEKYVR